jgi:uncharacterized protein
MAVRGWVWGVGTLVSVVTCLGVWSTVIEPDMLRVRHVVVTSGTWPATIPPLKIAVIADLHVGAPHIDLAKLDDVVAVANGLQPDLVLLLGDYVIQGVFFGNSVSPEIVAQRLSGLRAKYGVYAVLGNHDWWLDGPRVTRALKSNGITVLENEAASITAPAGRVWIAGIADDTTRTPEVVRTVAPLPAGEPILLITHDPAVFEDVTDRVALTLAGHTHGGQVYLPGIGALIVLGRAPRRHAYGLVRENGRAMFVTGGVGSSIIPVRFNMPPEVVSLTIQSRLAPAQGIKGQ